MSKEYCELFFVILLLWLILLWNTCTVNFYDGSCFCFTTIVQQHTNIFLISRLQNNISRHDHFASMYNNNFIILLNRLYWIGKKIEVIIGLDTSKHHMQTNRCFSTWLIVKQMLDYSNMIIFRVCIWRSIYSSIYLRNSVLQQYTIMIDLKQMLYPPTAW